MSPIPETGHQDHAHVLTPGRWQQIERLFQEALDVEPAARENVLAECTDPDLREEVASLLLAHDVVVGLSSKPLFPRSVLQSWLPSTEAVPSGHASEGTAPAIERIGSYRLLDTLGRGGMGRVVRGEHVGNGTLVALKTVRLPDERLFQGLRREIRALARIQHPGVVRIVDEGVHDGAPWYAMELVEGSTLRKLVALGGSESLEEILTPIRRLCETLAFLHGEGIVHRDLKPENILLRPDGTPVLVDFGLASEWPLAGLGRSTIHVKGHSDLSRDALEMIGRISGTVAYMAPEQARGEPVDARADLYALGCILYELLTGRPPFVSVRPVEVLHQHCYADPVPPSRRSARTVPSELDELVLHLLAKKAHERLGYAADVADSLARLSGENRTTAPAARPRDYLYRPRFQGREFALRELTSRLRRVGEGSGCVLFLAGESGSGKTRLAMELLAVAHRQGFQVLTGESLPRASGEESTPGRGVAPLEPLHRPLRAIADRCLARGPAETTRLLGPRLRILEPYEPALATLPEFEQAPEPAELPPEAARLRLFTALAETLEALEKESPVLLLLDDIHWSDDLTVGFLEFLLRRERLARLRLFVVATLRPEEATDALRSVFSSPSAIGMALAPLAEAAVGGIIADMLSLEAPPVGFVQALTRISEGNPYFAAEYLRAAVEEGLLTREHGPWNVMRARETLGAEPSFETLLRPRSLQELVGRRLDGLSSRSRAAVAAAAVLGREMDSTLLFAVAGLEGTDGADALVEPVWRLVLEEPQPGRLRFVHDTLRKAAYERIPTHDRLGLHRKAAEFIAADMRTRPSQEAERQLAGLGDHWANAGESDKARDCYLAAARRARDRYAYDEAGRLYRESLRLFPTPAPESVGARLELAWDVLRVQGRGQDAMSELAVALQECRVLRDEHLEAETLDRLGGIQHELGQMDEASRSLESALALAREHADKRLEGRVLSYLVLIHHDQGRTDVANAMYDAGVALARQVQDRPLEARFLNNLANLRHQQGRFDEARSLLEAALTIHRQTQNRSAEGLILGNLASLLTLQGRLADSERMHEQALAIHREVGARRHEGLALSNLANARAMQGHLDEARVLGRQALSIYRECGALRLEALALMNLGGTYKDEAIVEEAETLFRQSLVIFEKIGDRQHILTCLRALAILERQGKGHLDEAERLLRDGLARLADDYALERGLCLCELGHLELALDRSSEAYLDVARQLANQLSLDAGTSLGKAVDCLTRTEAAWRRGQPLFRGQQVEDLPTPLRERLAGAAEDPWARPAGTET